MGEKKLKVVKEDNERERERRRRKRRDILEIQRIHTKFAFIFQHENTRENKIK